MAQEFPTDFKWDQYSWIQLLGIFNPTLTKCWRIWCGRNIGKTFVVVDPSPFGESTSHSTPIGSSRVITMLDTCIWTLMGASKYIIYLHRGLQLSMDSHMWLTCSWAIMLSIGDCCICSWWPKTWLSLLDSIRWYTLNDSVCVVNMCVCVGRQFFIKEQLSSFTLSSLSLGEIVHVHVH
jgi:hypothetical protein